MLGVRVVHVLPPGRVAQVVVDPLGEQRLLEIELQDDVVAGVVPQQILLAALALETALRVGAAEGAAVRQDLFYLLLEMFHHEVVLLLSGLVVSRGLEPAQLARVWRAESVGVFR